ncbi:MAG: hypothetical protein VR73_09000 [Gammaproteobacteria bacterium BRH_c0]|nr:MAG: hypothetical protein VR73_09000 [Gammaproteobacteria bacterium BRH_c0]
MASINMFLEAGGPVVAILLAFSVVAVTVIAIKLWQFWSVRGTGNQSIRLALEHIESGDRAQALLLAGDRSNPRADIIARSLRLLEKPHLSQEEIQAEITRAARAHIASLGSQLRILEVIAVVAPLLGLFGTVLGMIAAFQAMAAAGSQVNPAVLSSGIWEALLTTAVGLAVAIPASLFNSGFERFVENTAAQMSDDIGRIFTAHAEHRSGEARKGPAIHKA